MVSHRVLTVAALAALSVLVATPAYSQIKAPARPQNHIPSPSLDLGGQIKGVCMISQAYLIGQSKAGQAASARIEQLAKRADREVTTMRDAFGKKVQAFRDQAQNMQPQQREDEQKKLQAEAESLQRKGTELERRLQLTRARALERIVTTAKPLLASAYKRHACGILLERDGNVVGGNEANDLTNEVVQALDKKMPTISFNLAELPTQANGK